MVSLKVILLQIYFLCNICGNLNAQAVTRSPVSYVGIKTKQSCLKYWPKNLKANFSPRYTIEEFPHVAALGYLKNKNIVRGCTGSLISEKFVLTTAYCLNRTNLGDVKFVRLGSSHLASSDSSGQSFNVVSVYSHPKNSPDSTYHNVALIELDRPAIFTKYVKPACLQVEKKIVPNPELILTSWKTVKMSSKSADVLIKIPGMKEFQYEDCDRIYPPSTFSQKGIDKDGQMCAGSKGDGICKADPGSPLQNSNSLSNGYTIVGIRSFIHSEKCKKTYIPAIYTRISNYIDWIEAIVWPDLRISSDDL